MPNQIRHHRAPVRIILGQRVRFQPHVDYAICVRAAWSGRTFEQETLLLMRTQLGI